MFSRHQRKAQVLFGLSDVLLAVLAFEAAYQTRVWLTSFQPLPGLSFEREFYLIVPVKALLLGYAVLVWVLIGRWLNVYNRLDSAHPKVVLRDAFRQCALGGVAVVLFQFALRLDLSRPFLALFLVYCWVLLCLFRLNAGRLVGIIRREFGAQHFVMIVGTSEAARRLGEALERSRRFGIELVGFVLEDRSREAPPQEIGLERRYPVFPLEDLGEILRRRVIDEVIFAVDGSRLPEFEEVFLECDEDGVRTRILIDFFPHVNSEMYLDRLGPAPLLTFSAAPHDEIRLLLKRVTDFLLAAAGLLLLAPLMALVALLIRLTSPGPAIFRQVRCGLNGRRFVFYKFRSMCENAEELKAAVAHLNSKQTAFKIPNDPRVTRIGGFLRKFSIDEWPQLWNVLKGDMSLVGPRPAVPEEVERYERWQRRRLRMRPGLTCLWALAGRDALDFDTWMKLDMEYIDSWSLSLDWKILFRTIPRVLIGKGAH